MRTPEGSASHVTSLLVGVFSWMWLMGQIGLEREREIHGLPGRGAERAPFRGQGGDQREPAPVLRARSFVHSNRQGPRRVVDVNAQIAAGAPDDKHYALTVA